MDGDKEVCSCDVLKLWRGLAGRGKIGEYFDRLEWSPFFGMGTTKDDFQIVFHLDWYVEQFSSSRSNCELDFNILADILPGPFKPHCIYINNHNDHVFNLCISDFCWWSLLFCLLIFWTLHDESAADFTIYLSNCSCSLTSKTKLWICCSQSIIIYNYIITQQANQTPGVYFRTVMIVNCFLNSQ